MSWRDPNFKYHPAASHNNDSAAFRERLKAYAAQVAAAKTKNVTPILTKKGAK